MPKGLIVRIYLGVPNLTICQRGGTVYTAGLEPVARKGLRVRISPLVPIWKGKPIGDGTALEKRRAMRGLEGSTPSPSAKYGV